MKICRDCRFGQFSTNGHMPRCLHPSATRPAVTNVVTGAKEPAEQMSCKSARSFSSQLDVGICGKGR